MKKLKFHNKLIGPAAIFILLTLSYLLLFYDLKQTANQKEQLAHGDLVILKLNQVQHNLHQTEYHYIGYILWSDSVHLKNFYSIIQQSKNNLLRLNVLIQNNAENKMILDSVTNVLFNRYRQLEQAVLQTTLQKPTAAAKEALLKLGYNPIEQNYISAGLHQIEQSQTAQLKKEKEQSQKLNKALIFIISISILLVIILGIWSFLLFKKAAIAQMEAINKAHLYKQQLEKRLEELTLATQKIKALKHQEKFASTGRIAHVLAHEIRNPLTNINLAVEQISENIEVNSDNNLLLDMIKRNSLRINKLISDLLSATKLTHLNFQKENAETLINELLQQAADSINLKHIELVKQFHHTDSYIMAAKEKLKIALFNILINAVEAVPVTGGKIIICTQLTQETFELIIEDNGIGMTEEEMQRLFEPFFTSKSKGNGLGLTNAQNIILNHKGSIQVESVKTVGTKFIIHLPLSV